MAPWSPAMSSAFMACLFDDYGLQTVLFAVRWNHLSCCKKWLERLCVVVQNHRCTVMRLYLVGLRFHLDAVGDMIWRRAVGECFRNCRRFKLFAPLLFPAFFYLKWSSILKNVSSPFPSNFVFLSKCTVFIFFRFTSVWSWLGEQKAGLVVMTTNLLLQENCVKLLVSGLSRLLPNSALKLCSKSS